MCVSGAAGILSLDDGAALLPMAHSYNPIDLKKKTLEFGKKGKNHDDDAKEKTRAL